MKIGFRKHLLLVLSLILCITLCSCTAKEKTAASRSEVSSQSSSSKQADTDTETSSTKLVTSEDKSSSTVNSNKFPASSSSKTPSPDTNSRDNQDYEDEDEYEYDDDYDYDYGYNRPSSEPVPDKTLSPFTIAIYPDTQQEVLLDNAVKNKHFLNRTQWLVDNADALNLKFAIHTGDIVNWGNEDPKQFDIASEALAPLDKAKIPTLLCLGNHDTAAVGVGGSAADPQNTWVRVRNTTAFNKAFPTSRYPDFVPYENGKIDNGFQLISAGGLKWLVMTLELWPRDEVIDWANLVISDYSDYNVIIATHSYLTSDGSIYQRSEYGNNSPQKLYDKLIKMHPNIKMVFSGHTGTAAYREDRGVYGNKIACFLGCFHSNDKNPLQLMEVDPKNDSVYIRTFCPIDNSEWSQFSRTVGNMGFIKP